MFTFATFEPGREIGRREFVLEPHLVERWGELFPEDASGDVMPAGMVAIVTSRAYSDILLPRPAGNVHGSQRFEIVRLPRVGERLTTTLGCQSKEMKGERRWVKFVTDTTDESGRTCFRGLQTVMWAE